MKENILKKDFKFYKNFPNKLKGKIEIALYRYIKGISPKSLSKTIKKQLDVDIDFTKTNSEGYSPMLFMVPKGYQELNNCDKLFSIYCRFGEPRIACVGNEDSRRQAKYILDMLNVSY